MALDARERPFHCHHEKLVVVDDETAFVGGIDLTAFSGDRLDSNEHPHRDGLGWHDTALRLEGPVVADVARHFHTRWHTVGPNGLPEPGRPSAVEDGVEAQFVRTVPERLYEPYRDGEWSILESYLRALRSAEKFVYLESQFLWSPEVTFVLADKLRRPPCDDFRVIALLPSQPNNGADDSRGQVGILIDADKEAGGDTPRFLACTLYQPGPGGNPVYVHSKAAVVDDAWLTIGSANLNEHSLFNDTECNVVVRDPALVREVRLRLWEEHLERPREEIDGDPARVFDELWKPLAEERLERRRRDGWADGKLTLLPHVSRRAEALWGPLNGLLVDG
jgi:phosphatidylserine/phosphatidylglycerophosphate/cardiolipin synthase-like enzyme